MEKLKRTKHDERFLWLVIVIGAVALFAGSFGPELLGWS